MLLSVLLIYMQIITTIWATEKLQEHFHWNTLRFAFPSLEEEAHAIQTGRYVRENNLPVGIEIWKDKIFISVPRWRQGIPSTLNYVPLDNSESKSPALRPYPDWKSTDFTSSCAAGLTTVYRMKADECDRLWVLDTGTVGIGNTTQHPCPYALNVFDLHNDRLLRRYELRPEDVTMSTFIANIVVDVAGGCDDTFAYMSDELGYGLIVYSWYDNKSWRFTHSFFQADPLRGDFNIDGLNFQWSEEGIFGMSLSPPTQPSGYKRLYFSPLASHRQFVVSTQVLRNSSRVSDSFKDFVALAERGPLSHTTARVMNRNGVEFFNLIDRNAVGCWNSLNPYQEEYLAVVDEDEEKLVFPSDIKVDETGNVWVMSDRMSTFLIAFLNASETNFRVFFAPADALTQNTVCDINFFRNSLLFDSVLIR